MRETVKRIQKARQSCVTVNDFRFTTRRPTDIEAARFHSEGKNVFDWVLEFTIDWARADGSPVLGTHLGGDTNDAEPFEPELWREWLSDNSEYWQPIYKHITQQYDNFLKSK